MTQTFVWTVTMVEQTLQSVYLWLCGATNGNQLWATVFHHQFGATIQLPEGAD